MDLKPHPVLSSKDFLIILIKRTVNFIHINSIINNKNCSKYYYILL